MASQFVETASRHLLVINGGSSNVKFAVFAEDATANRILNGKIESIGTPNARLTFHRNSDASSERTTQPIEALSPSDAALRLLEVLDREFGLSTIKGIGHRIVHGGAKLSETCRIDDSVIAELRRLAPLDPTHLPSEIAIVEAMRLRLPGVPEVACFDTAFHRDLPKVAAMLPIPRHFAAEGVRKYGFHGLSYAYLLQELRNTAGDAAANGRVILIHLGGGASMAAVKNGKCIDTTMAFTPTAGLVMGTRSGDLDPGVLIYLMREKGFSLDALDRLVNDQSGLLGLSEVTADMRELKALSATDERAAEAIAIYCYQAKKWLGAMTAALNGLDTLVFAGGIGENSSDVRRRICEGLEFLGVRLNATKNDRNGTVISSEDSAICVRVIHTDEEQMIVRELQRLLAVSN